MRGTLRFILHFALVVLITLIIANFDLIRYGFLQLSGQLKIINHTIPVEDALKSNELSDEQKRKLLLIQEIKKFAVDSLGLIPSDNYTSFYNQHNKPVLWVLTACQPYRLKSYRWKFPLIGYVSYKGFFEKEKAKPEYEKLINEGYDADLSPVSAWSTLGFFNDPVLSDFLKRNDGRIAELIIHELTHGTIYIKSSVDYNENLATFIGEHGAARFLVYRYGSNSKQLNDYTDYKSDEDLYGKLMISGAAKLDSLYKTFSDSVDKQTKESLKKNIIISIMRGLDSIPFYNKQLYYFDLSKMPLPNNTDFMINATYRSMQHDCEKKLADDNNDLKKFIVVQKKK